MSEGYKQLEIYQRAHKLAVEIHQMSLKLPKHELFEEGGQIRRASKSVAAQIVEGYCLRKNKSEFVQYLNRAYASCHESAEHLDLLFETGSLDDKMLYGRLRADVDVLCRMIYRFMESVVEGHEKPRFVKDGEERYEVTSDAHLATHIPHRPDEHDSPTSPISHPTSG